MSTIIVTGGAGFIGSNFVRKALSETRHEIVVVDRLTYAGNLANLPELDESDRVTFHEADIADREAVAELYRDSGPVAVLNFAAESHVDRSIDDPGNFIHSNIVGTFVLLEAARRYLDEAPNPDFRFLQVSTDEVYGSLGATGSFTEETPYAPNSPYSASKASADHLVRAYHHTFALPTLTTNCSNNYGPYQFPEKLIPLMLLNALEGRPLPIYGDGQNVRDWLFVEDHCSGILTVLQEGAPGETYNFGGDEERTNLQLIDELCTALELLRPARENEALAAGGVDSYAALKEFVADRPGHDQRYAMNSSKVRRELGWQPSVGLADGLQTTVAWYLDHLGWCRTVQADSYGRERLGLTPTEAR